MKMTKKKARKTAEPSVSQRFARENASATVRAENVKHLRGLVEEAFRIPETLGFADGGGEGSTRVALDAQLRGLVGMDGIVDSLVGHAAEMGQFPYTSFVGYGALQQIAQNGMIRNCIKTVADDVTRAWIKITGGVDTDPAKLEELQNAQDRTYHLQAIFNHAIAKVGFMGGAFIFLKTEPNEETGDINTSLPLMLSEFSAEVKKGASIGFVVVDPINVSPAAYNSFDPLREDYMRPSKWLVLGREVHSTRLMPLYVNEPPTLLKPAYNFLGIPQAQILWDYVLHWNECRVSTQELLKKLSLMVYYTDMQDRMSDPNGVAALDGVMDVLQRYRDNNSVFVANNETDRVEVVSMTISGASDIVRQSQEIIAAINRTPAVKLFGISPSGFNATGESDLRNYNDHIRSQQELYRPVLQRCLDAIQLVLWGEIDPSISFEWNELDIDNESSLAMNFSSRVNALAALKDRNAISAEEMRDAVRKERSSRLEWLDDEAPPEEDGDLMTDSGMLDDLFGSGKNGGLTQEENRDAKAQDGPSN